jgi:hypothetical protein
MVACHVHIDFQHWHTLRCTTYLMMQASNTSTKWLMSSLLDPLLLIRSTCIAADVDKEAMPGMMLIVHLCFHASHMLHWKCVLKGGLML